MRTLMVSSGWQHSCRQEKTRSSEQSENLPGEEGGGPGADSPDEGEDVRLPWRRRGRRPRAGSRTRRASCLRRATCCCRENFYVCSPDRASVLRRGGSECRRFRVRLRAGARVVRRASSGRLWRVAWTKAGREGRAAWARAREGVARHGGREERVRGRIVRCRTRTRSASRARPVHVPLRGGSAALMLGRGWVHVEALNAGASEGKTGIQEGMQG